MQEQGCGPAKQDFENDDEEKGESEGAGSADEAELDAAAELGQAADEPELHAAAAKPGNAANEPEHHAAAEPGHATDEPEHHAAAEPGHATDEPKHHAADEPGHATDDSAMDGTQMEAEVDPKDLAAMIGSFDEVMDVGEDSVVSSIPTIKDYKLAFSQEEVEQMLQPSYDMIFGGSAEPPPGQPEPGSAEEITSSPGALSVDSIPTPEPPRACAIARLPHLQQSPGSRTDKQFQSGISDRLSPQQKLLFIELCKKKLQDLNDFTRLECDW